MRIGWDASVGFFTCTEEPVSRLLQRLMLFFAGRSKRGDANGSKKTWDAEKPLFLQVVFSDLISHLPVLRKSLQTKEKHIKDKTKTCSLCNHRA